MTFFEYTDTSTTFSNLKYNILIKNTEQRRWLVQYVHFDYYTKIIKLKQQLIHNSVFCLIVSGQG